VDGSFAKQNQEQLKMIFDRRTFLALTAGAGSVALAGTAFAAGVTKHVHNDGMKLLGGRIGTDGKHKIHEVGAHSAHVHVKGKKIAGMSVTHRTKGEVPVKKYKTSKRLVQGDGYIQMGVETSGLFQRADFQVAQTIVDVGYSYIDPDTGIETYYWYPAEMVVDPDTGAVAYIPLA
jgi:hypothetical protein